MVNFLNIDSLGDKSENWFKAKTVKNQFNSLREYMYNKDIREEISMNSYFNKVTASKSANIKKVESLLLNSLNTEYILRLNKQIVEHIEHACLLQWAFPQAYYSTFNAIRALYHTLGYTEADTSHTNILKKFSLIIVEDKLPKSISFYSTGGKNYIMYGNIIKPTGIKTMSFCEGNNETIENQICQFLKSTRELKLDDRKEKYCQEFFKKNKKIKKNLNKNDWKDISTQIGSTTIMDLLYRNHIKSNYGEVDSFTSEEFEDGSLVLNSLCDITYQLNFIFEIYIGQAIGIDKFNSIVQSNYSKYNFAEERAKNILDIINNRVTA